MLLALEEASARLAKTRALAAPRAHAATRGSVMTMEYVSLPGETAPPVPDGPRLCDGDDMSILHHAFRWG